MRFGRGVCCGGSSESKPAAWLESGLEEVEVEFVGGDGKLGYCAVNGTSRSMSGSSGELNSLFCDHGTVPLEPRNASSSIETESSNGKQQVKDQAAEV